VPALREYKALLQSVTRKMQACPKPFVAAVQGYAVGAGCELALSCDLIVAEEGARFGFPEVTVGLTITNGGTYFLPRLVGMARAKELAFLGEPVEAEACRQMGLVNRVVPAGGARGAALAMAQTIASRAPLSVQIHKAAINRAAGTDLETALSFEAELAVLSLLSEDHREGARAFLEKRPPRFVGR
jgi:enoyl-CoA hydratase/carnithine racemase